MVEFGWNEIGDGDVELLAAELAAERQRAFEQAKEMAAQVCEQIKQVRLGSELLRGAFEGEDSEGWRNLRGDERQILKAASKAIRALRPPDAPGKEGEGK